MSNETKSKVTFLVKAPTGTSVPAEQCLGLWLPLAAGPWLTEAPGAGSGRPGSCARASGSASCGGVQSVFSLGLLPPWAALGACSKQGLALEVQLVLVPSTEPGLQDAQEMPLSAPPSAQCEPVASVTVSGCECSKEWGLGLGDGRLCLNDFLSESKPGNLGLRAGAPISHLPPFLWGQHRENTRGGWLAVGGTGGGAGPPRMGQTSPAQPPRLGDVRARAAGWERRPRLLLCDGSTPA